MLDSQTKRIVDAAAAVYGTAFGDGFAGLVVHGSAVVGDAIPGCSDVDVKLLLAGDAFENGQIPFPIALEVQRGLANIDLGPYAYLQCYAASADPERGPRPVALVPGTYEVVAGQPEFPTYDADGLRASSLTAIEGLPGALAGKANGLLNSGPERFERQIRFTATEAWPAVRAALTIAGCDPLLAWREPKRRAIDLLTEQVPECGRLAAAYYATVIEYFGRDRTVETGLASLRTAVDFFASVQALAKVRTLSAG